VVLAGLGFSRVIVGSDEPNRHIVLRVPYSDERAERLKPDNFRTMRLDL
jgi:hypothetical protein